MKKAIIFVLCTIFCIATTSCIGNTSDDTKSKSTNSSMGSLSSTVSSSSTSSVISSASTNSVINTASSDKQTSSSGSSAKTMAQFIQSIQQQTNQLSAALEGSGMSLVVSARGNSLVYSYKYGIDIGSTATIKPSLEQTLNAMSSVFSSVLTTLRTEVPSAESIIVEYLDKSGSVIVSKEFK